jgi:predicted DNA-binding transcriptional regulator AlpA
MIAKKRRPQVEGPETAKNQTGIPNLIAPSTLAASIAPLLAPRDLANILRITRRCIEQMRSAGRIPPPDLMLGRLPRWRPETIRAWIEEGGAK